MLRWINLTAFLRRVALFPLCLLFLSMDLHASSADIDDVKALARLYSAAFDREPGIDGLNFWVDSYEKGRPFMDIAKDFYNSPEFTRKYGPLSESQYVEQLYRNVLRREGAQSGIDFWLDKLLSGTSRARILASFAGSPENIAKTEDTFANMRLEDGLWLFGSAQNTGNASVSGLIEEGTLLLTDRQGKILRVAFAFGQEPNGDLNVENNYFTFSELPTNRSLSLYYVKSGDIYAVFGGNAGNPKSNVFTLSDKTSANLGLVNSNIIDDGKLLAQFSILNQTGVSAQPANARIPIGIERPPVAGLNTEELTQAGLGALYSGWISGANAYLEKVVATTTPKSSQEADNARFYLAFSTLASISSESLSDGNTAAVDRIGDILDLVGIPDDLRRGSPNWIVFPETLDQNRITAEEISEHLERKMNRNIDRSIELLSQVSPSFKGSWIRKDSRDRVENDYGDALFFLGSLKLLHAYAALIDAYNLDADLNAVASRNTDDIEGNDVTVEQFLNNNPNFLSLADRRQLAKASDLLVVGAINNLERALASIESETDSQEDDLIRISTLDSSEISRTKNYLTNIKKSINQGETVILADSSGDRRKDVILNLKRFFTTGVDFRGGRLLPAIDGNDLDLSRPCLPDPTFNGVVISPDLNTNVYDENTCN